ncbi:Metacaspase-1B-like protein [Cladobotryum mycophilum]|uniref:Metacaspase-1B-like protein n=1 Tax=Cladobotryum mycophilum TaxID=491253 RepID=A0ABR0T513_9HYPO
MPAISKPTFWAFLIGINYYPQYTNLQGCIPDVEAVEKLLREMRPDSMQLHIEKITAADKNGPHPPPTYENIVNTFERIAKEAKPGDMFHFHYSGHGGSQERTTDNQHPLKNLDGGKRFEVLALHGERNLKDYELGRILDRFGRAGVRTTAVLDCCHSGGADRADNIRVRGIEGVIPADGYDVDDSPYDDNGEETDGKGLRAATQEDSYWVRARTYTFITACQPMETASDGSDESGCGFLTCNFVKSARALRASGRVPTYKTLYWDIRAGMSGAPHQNPMIYGEQDFYIFRRTTQPTVRRAIVNGVENNGSRVEISIGQLHGVCVGEVYAIYPREVLDLSTIIGKIRIDSVSANRSHGTLLVAGGTTGGEQGNVQRGCPVSLVTPIGDSLRVKIQDPELLEALQKQPRSLVDFIGDSYSAAAASHQVLFRDSHYEITTASGTRLPNSPTFSKDGDPATGIFKFLQRVAHYITVAQLHNRNPGPLMAFDFHERDGLTEVLHEGRIYLELKNLNPIPPYWPENTTGVLYFSIVNFSVDWKVEVVVPGPRQAFESLSINPQEINDECGMIMTIPTEADLEATDTFKVIVTTMPCQFDLLNTPAETGRGTERPYNYPLCFEDLMRPGADRTARAIEYDTSDWQTAGLNIKIMRNAQN